MMATLEGADKAFAANVQRMIDESGGRLTLTSGFRSEQEQQVLWDRAVAKYGSEAAARKWVAPPGHSKHGEGIAADIGGDRAYLAQVAPKYGLYLPMEWEPWHVEPIGSRDGGGAGGDHSQASTTPPDGFTPKSADHMATLMSLLGGVGDAALSQPSFAHQIGGRSPVKTGGTTGMMPGDGAMTPGADDTMLDAFRMAIRAKESTGDYGAIGKPTRYGTAKGAYQYLDGTWGHYRGFATARDAPPAIQDEKARLDMQALYERFGDWNAVASAWFAGPSGNFALAEVRQYASDVMGRMGGR